MRYNTTPRKVGVTKYVNVRKNFKSELIFLQTCNEYDRQFGEEWYNIKRKQCTKFNQFLNFFKFIILFPEYKDNVQIMRGVNTQYCFFVFLTKYRKELHSILESLNIFQPTCTGPDLPPDIAYDIAYESYQVDGLFKAAEKLANNIGCTVFTATLSNDKTIMIGFKNDDLIKDKNVNEHIESQSILINNSQMYGTEFDTFIEV